jgi:hypothetical protein
MPRVRIDSTLPNREQLDIRELRNRWHAVFGRPAPPHLPRHLLFRILGCRPIAWVIWTVNASVCWIVRARLRGPVRTPWIRFGASLTCGLERSLAASGMGRCNGWPSLPTALPGTARPIRAYRRSPSPLPAPDGTVQDSLASAISRRRRPQHEGRIRKNGSLRRSIPASRPTKGSNRTSTRSMPSMTPRRPISEAKPMQVGHS